MSFSEQWIRQPLNDLRKITERLDVVEALLNDTVHRSTLHDDLLRRVPDLAALGRRLVRRKAGLQVRTPSLLLYFVHSCICQHFVLAKEKRERDTVTCQAKKIINPNIVVGFSEFLFYISAILSDHKFVSVMSA